MFIPPLSLCIYTYYIHQQQVPTCFLSPSWLTFIPFGCHHRRQIDSRLFWTGQLRATTRQVMVYCCPFVSLPTNTHWYDIAYIYSVHFAVRWIFTKQIVRILPDCLINVFVIICMSQVCTRSVFFCSNKNTVWHTLKHTFTARCERSGSAGIRRPMTATVLTYPGLSVCSC